jgi:hypothetical protein
LPAAPPAFDPTTALNPEADIPVILAFPFDAFNRMGNRPLKT